MVWALLGSRETTMGFDGVLDRVGYAFDAITHKQAAQMLPSL